MRKQFPIQAIFDRFRKSWFVTDILFPFLLTRALLLLVGMLVQVIGLPISSEYPIARVLVDRWHFSPYLVLDMWMRWDTGWFFRLASVGYTDLENLGITYSSLAFYPMYPGLIRVILDLFGAKVTATSFGLAGVFVSNLSFLAGLAGLRQLTVHIIKDPAAGRRVVWWVFVFPVSFFFSTVFTESLWFASTVFSLLAAQRKRWALAGVLGILATLTRANGILVLIPLGWMYMTERNWDLRRLDWQVLWLGLPAFSLAGWFALWYPITGHLAAPMVAQGGWSRSFSWPWQALFTPTANLGMITRVEQVFLIIGLLLAVWALWQGLSRVPAALPLEFTLFTLVLLIFPLFAGHTQSALRYEMGAFPLYVIAASWRGDRWIQSAMAVLLFLFQLYLFSRWCLFYWVG